MKKPATACFAVAVFLLATRLCTGLVYGHDSPVTYLVLKSPSLAWERTETESVTPEQHVLASADPVLPLQGAYSTTMTFAPAFILVAALAGFGMLIASGRRPVPHDA